MNNKRASLLRKIVIVIVGLMMFVPLYICIINSFKSTEDIIRNPFSPFVDLTFNNIRSVFVNPNMNMFNMYKNSFALVIVSLIIILVITPMAGYYIARSSKKRGNLILTIYLAGMMIPPQVMLIPLVKIYSNLGLLGSFTGMYIFYSGAFVSVAVMLFSKYIKSIPYELEESAYIDGANPLMVFWRIIFPLLKPVTATVAIFVGRAIWNDFLMPLYLLGGKGSETVTTGIYKAIGPYSADWGTVFATVFVSAIPMVILFLSMQKHFMGGLTDGAVKS
ncbi:carbohydrate ABC transporter permease [Vallitalea sp.]|uniref:carbohydrate ABC transporter permease n=1 Tax=Vallitalea sp. TaxID=1882829 RepID=UPI0025D0922C|nr:carbohydrate ABC transporter permease [Vallitalea sp.]MCT4685909.1 carbohydrate ABC transporter permease [Vallitalea sp.]